MAMRLSPNDEREYQEQLRSSSRETFELALLLHAAAFCGDKPTVPAPVYMRQAVWFAEKGYHVTVKQVYDKLNEDNGDEVES